MTEERRMDFDRDEIVDLLTELGRRLAGRGVEATLYVVGGAAMAIEFDRRRVTRDVDAVFEPRTTVAAVAAEMADELGLPADWLSDRVKAFLPGDDQDAVPFAVEGVSVALASPAHLLAMKMAAFRPGDRDDLNVLFEALEITSADEAADLALSIYGEESVVLPDRDELILRAQGVLGRT